MEIHICNLPLIDDGNTIQVKTVWSDSNMTISILDENAAWKGSLTYSQLSQLSHTFNTCEEEHREKCKQALTSDQGIKDFSYHLDKNCFVWKKKILTDMKIKFGQIDVHSVPVSEVSQEIMSTLISQNSTYKCKLATYEQAISKLETENTELLRTLEEFTDAKLRSEQILLGKFATLLNIKKQRIACLEKLLFKNLCSDKEESKAFRQVDQMNFDSETDPEDEESMATSDPMPGPSRIQITTIVCEDTDDEDEGPFRRDTRSNTPSPTRTNHSPTRNETVRNTVTAIETLRNHAKEMLQNTVTANETLRNHTKEMLQNTVTANETQRHSVKTNKTQLSKTITDTSGPGKKLKLSAGTSNQFESNSTEKDEPLRTTLPAQDQSYHKPVTEMNSQELLDLI